MDTWKDAKGKMSSKPVALQLREEKYDSGDINEETTQRPAPKQRNCSQYSWVLSQA